MDSSQFVTKLCKIQSFRFILMPVSLRGKSYCLRDICVGNTKTIITCGNTAGRPPLPTSNSVISF